MLTHFKNSVSHGKKRVSKARKAKPQIPWEAAVLPLHHSRENEEPPAFSSVFGTFDLCN